MRITDDVLEDERIFAVREDALERTFGSRFERGVDFLNRRFFRKNRAEVSDRTGRCGNAERSTLKLAVQLRNHEADCLRCPGRGRNDVLRSGPGAAKVAVRCIEDDLVTGVGVNRAHETLFDTEGVIEDLHHRREAVRGAGSIGNDVVLCRIVEPVVDADAESQIRIFRRSGDDDLLGTRFDVLSGTGAVDEETGGFENNVDALASPVEIRRVALSGRNDAVAVHGDGLLIILNRSGEATRSGVILKQVRQSLVVSEVVDRDDLLELFIGHRAQDIASDPSKSVNSVGCHNRFSKRVSFQTRSPVHSTRTFSDSTRGAAVAATLLTINHPSKEKPLPKLIQESVSESGFPGALAE